MPRTARRILVAFAGLVALLAVAAAALIGPYAMRTQYVEADPAAGYASGYYLYVPSDLARRGPSGLVTLLVQPNNSGTNSDDIGVHRRDAWWTGFERRALADELGVALLVPSFPRPATGWQVYTHALDRDVLTTERPEFSRLDRQLLAMVDHARSTLAAQGQPVDSRMLIQGFSASGMFANRFAALHPRRIKAAAIGSPGGWPIAPATHHGGEALPYPAGTADLEELTGVPFDAQGFNAVPQLIYMGAADDNDSLDFEDGWDRPASAQVDRLFGADPRQRWPHAERMYREAGSRARFLLVDGVGHDRQALQAHATRFFAKVLQEEAQASGTVAAR